ncbi:MAG: site-specific DNA-methyltransferase [Nitrosopumilaceae archaeon]|nr:site-specific DNA-methyltransferase [Nitrosopumilaceae archaeon]
MALVVRKYGLANLEPYYQTADGALYNGDSIEIMRFMKSDSIDCIFADPPFNLGKDYGTKFVDKNENYVDWCGDWMAEGARILTEGGALFIYCMPSIAVRLVERLNRLLTFRHWIALTMKGSYPRGKKLYPAHYALLYYTKGKPKTFNSIRTPVQTCRHCGGEIKDYGGHRKALNPLGLNLTDFWDDTSPNRHAKYKVRPGVNELKITIPKRAVLLSTNPGDTVLDPFGGGGSTYEVCEQHSRKWIGIEKYDCSVIRTRLQRMQSQLQAEAV